MVDQETEVFLSLQFSMTWKFASGSCTQPLAACYSPPPTTQCKVTVTDCTPSSVSTFPLCPWPGLCGLQDLLLSNGRMGMGERMVQQSPGVSLKLISVCFLVCQHKHSSRKVDAVSLVLKYELWVYCKDLESRAIGSRP